MCVYVCLYARARVCKQIHRTVSLVCCVYSERLYQGPESGDVYSDPQPNTTGSPSNPFSLHSLLRPTPQQSHQLSPLLRPTRTPQQSHQLSPLLRPTPQQPHRPPPTPDQPVYPPLLQSAHPYANTGPAHNITGMSAYPSNTSYLQLPYYRLPASSPFSASQPTHSTPPWFMPQYPYMGMNTNPYTEPPYPPYPPPFQHPSSNPEYINPQVPTDSLPTGPGPPGLLSGLPVNTSGQYMVFTCCQISHFIRVLMLTVKWENEYQIFYNFSIKYLSTNNNLQRATVKLSNLRSGIKHTMS